VDKVRCFLSAQQLALELLTNICTAEDDGMLIARMGGGYGAYHAIGATSSISLIMPLVSLLVHLLSYHWCHLVYLLSCHWCHFRRIGQGSSPGCFFSSFAFVFFSFSVCQSGLANQKAE
jgi:hypothetical protein